MIPQIQKAMTTQPKGLTAAILVFLMLAAAITAVAPAASGTPHQSAQAQTNTEGICDRTEGIRSAIVAAVPLQVILIRRTQ